VARWKSQVGTLEAAVVFLFMGCKDQACGDGSGRWSFARTSHCRVCGCGRVVDMRTNVTRSARLASQVQMTRADVGRSMLCRSAGCAVGLSKSWSCMPGKQVLVSREEPWFPKFYERLFVCALCGVKVNNVRIAGETANSHHQVGY
jgi:hypothetical protein